MYQFKNIPLTMSGVLKDGWELYKDSFKYVWMWSLVTATIHIVPSLFGFVGFYRVSGNYLVLSWTAIISYMVLLIVESYFLTVFFYTIYSIATKQKVNFSEVFSLARSILINMYFASLLYFLGVNIGVYLFILPGVFIAILFTMYLPVLIIEQQTIYTSFVKSTRLVWGHWWQTFFILVVPYMISYLLRNFLRFVPWDENSWILLVDLIVLVIFMPYFYSILLVQFNNLKLLKSLPVQPEENPRLQS